MCLPEVDDGSCSGHRALSLHCIWLLSGMSNVTGRKRGNEQTPSQFPWRDHSFYWGCHAADRLILLVPIIFLLTNLFTALTNEATVHNISIPVMQTDHLFYGQPRAILSVVYGLLTGQSMKRGSVVIMNWENQEEKLILRHCHATANKKKTFNHFWWVLEPSML